MKNKIQTLLSQTLLLTSDIEKRKVTFALLRIILQHACITLVEELIRIRKSTPDIAFQRNPLPLDSLRAPSDGTLVAILGELMVLAENEGWSGISRGFWQENTSGRPCSRLIRSSQLTVESILRALIVIRNDEEHGIPGNYDSQAEIDSVAFVLEGLESVLPEIGKHGELVIRSSQGNHLTLQLLKTIRGDLICYRKILRSPSGNCIVRAQRQISLLTREDIAYEAPDLLGTPGLGSYPQYSTCGTFDPEWNPFVLLPDRLTTSFVGRDNEIDEITDWFDDPDSRVCMLYGDGGIGKTTLAVEFVHRLMNGDIKVAWHPEIITFFTSKQTRWGIKGLEVIRSRPATITDICLSIVRAFESNQLERDWYAARNPEDVINKLTGYLGEWGLNRNNHMIILDNTETLITSDEDFKSLALYIRELSRKIGRILLTSRRREAVEARQIEIKPLNVDESVSLLKARAKTLNRQAILQAGNSRLRQYADRLGNKPLVLEVFVQALGEHGIGLERAFDRVLRMQRQDLGEFLYTDAWNRMSLVMRHLLLLMTRLGDLHDELSLKLCCHQTGVTVLEASDALEESRGIANISKIDGHLQIAFNPDFMKYCSEKFVTIENQELPTTESVQVVRRRYNEFLQSASARISDRVEKAYRHPLARAAYQAYKEGKFEDAELFYEEAVLKDSGNGWLFDRYAYVLFSRERYLEAHEIAVVATRLLPKDPEVWFTRGMIEARLVASSPKMLEQAVASLNFAASYGKEEHMCLLQKAYAFINENPVNKNLVRKTLNESEKKAPFDHPYRWKHMSEIGNLRQRLEKIESNM